MTFRQSVYESRPILNLATLNTGRSTCHKLAIMR